MTFDLRTIRLGDTGIETTVLGFGCADLFREPSRAGRRTLLDAAFDAGIRHFDVAPMYGLGLAESELGRFARGKRDKIAIATKFGIEPSAASRLISRLQGPIHRMLGWLPMGAGRARQPGDDPRSGALGALLYRADDYSARAARASLERSLRELQTDYVDVLFLHDPRPDAAISDDVRAYLESARAMGRIRAWGVAGEPVTAVEAAQRLATPVPILQMRGDVFSRASWRVPTGSAKALILFGVIGRALARILGHLRSDPRVQRRWSEAIGVDCNRPEEIAGLLLRDALRANPEGTVLFSTTRADRIDSAAAAARAAKSVDPGVDALQALVRAELTAAQCQP